MRGLGIAAFLGLALGYSTFYFVFPNAAVPASEEASLPLLFGVLSTTAILAGLVTEEIPSGVVQGFASIPIGIAVAFLLAVSPITTGLVEVQPDDILSFVVRQGLPLYLLAVPLYNVFGVIGLAIRERFGFRSAPFLGPSGKGQRK